MTNVDVWAPRERDADWKEFAEPAAAHDSSQFAGAIFETDCPGCGHHVGALVIDGPDPVFVDLACPRDACEHEWSERVA